MSEDCLFLNIWRPAKSGRFPVMVWVHGGGYAGGTGNSEMYFGDRMAAAGDVVVVTINYRLNVFGFFPLAALQQEDEHKAAGGQGALDHIAALEWVRDNIESFGGDPGNVTVFGESAGGYSICMLVATPLAKSLFHRAIMESGGCEDAPDAKSGFEWAATAMPKMVGCRADDLDCLRALPAAVVLKKLASGMGDGMGGHQRPHADGYLLTASPLEMIRAGNYNRVPFIGGFNREEAAALMKLQPKLYYAPPWLYERRIRELGFTADEAKRIAAAYPLSDYRNRVVLAIGQMAGSDGSFGCETWRGLVALSEKQPEVYFYRFEYEGFRFSGAIGVAHAMEMPYVFDSLDRAPINLLYSGRQEKAGRSLVRTMQGYWLNFARTGDPNGAGLPEWPRFTAAAPQVQVFDAETKPRPETSLGERCKMWEEIGHMPRWE
jgi:para-nitrobenzyl esterase